ncbi:MAG: 50S ribosome-binding GTPase [Proteobacteria bacterium]|nr:50S ribosome-binding GTPase [Pseudomonadota bacterium]
MSTDLARHGRDPLADLLRRCHREELLPLARRVGVNPQGLGLDKLATIIGHALRRRGSGQVANAVFRGGHGPSYEAVLDRLVRKAGIQPSADAERMELALMEWVLRRSWDAMDHAEKQVVWADLELSGPLPGDGDTAVSKAKNSLGSRFAWTIARTMGFGAASLAGVVLPMLLPMAGCATLFYLARPRDEIVIPAVLEVGRLRQQLRHRVTVGVVGSPSSGKDAAIHAIFGIEGHINPVAGSTTEVAITKLPDATALYVVNTPGMGDVVEAVTEEARQVLALIDVYVYVLNAQGGVQQRELADYGMCVNSGRPVLVVVNKIDTLRDEDRAGYLADARDKLGAPEESFLAAAFDPLPQLSETPIGVEAVQSWLASSLDALGKDTGELPWTDDVVSG